MDAAYSRKVNHYAKIVDDYLADPMTITPWPLSAPVVPLAIESYGALSREVTTLMRHLASNYESSCTSGHAPGARTLFLAKHFRRISTALWLGNAATVHWAIKGGRPAHFRVPGRATGSRSLSKLTPSSAHPPTPVGLPVPVGAPLAPPRHTTPQCVLRSPLSCRSSLLPSLCSPPLPAYL